MIENRYTYAKFKILRSLFSKRIKKPFHIMVFTDKKEKIAYDLEILSRDVSSSNYSKKHRNNYTHKYGRMHYDYFSSLTSNTKSKPITLTYYLND